MEIIYRNPDFAPYNDIKFKGTWIKIEAVEILYQTAFARDKKGGLMTGKKGPTWFLLAPAQIMETINNTWEPWETMSSKILGKHLEYYQLKEQWGTIKGSLTTLTREGEFLQLVGEAYKNLTSMDKTKAKVDTPLVYENTNRRDWTLEFKLSAATSSQAKDMMEIIRSLESYSLPLRAGDLIKIDLPYAFSIKSEPNEHIINVDFAALTSIQPTFMAPYDEEGQPMRVELTCTFTEIPPLYGDSESLKYKREL